MNQLKQFKYLMIIFAITVNNKGIYLQLIRKIKFNYDKFPQENYFAHIFLSKTKVISQLK